MILFIFYQAPIFPCPIISEENRYYFTAEECVSLQYQQKTFFTVKKHVEMKESEVNHLFLGYVLFSQTFGLNKIYQNSFFYFAKFIFMLLFFFLGLLQRRIWNHPFTQTYVEPYLKRQKSLNCEKAKKYVENVHLKRIWSYKKIMTQKDVFLSLQKRVDLKVKQWENLLMNRDVKEEEILPFKQLENDGVSDEIRIKAEKLVLESSTGYLSLDEIITILKECNGDEKKAKVIILRKQFQSRKNDILSIYSIKEINLIDYHEKRRQELETEEQENEEKMIENLKKLEENKKDDVPSISDSLIKIEEKPKKWYLTLSLKLEDVFWLCYNSIKGFLLNYVHKTFFYEPGKYDQASKEPLLMIIVYYFISHLDKICFLLFIINHIVNDNILSIVFPASIFLYALLENPMPLKIYWKTMIFYCIFLISVKFVYQLPLFCGSPVYSIFYYSNDGMCSPKMFIEADLIDRIDYILGIHKFSGNSSYPKNVGFFFGVLWDYLVLIFLLFYRYLNESLGFWKNIRIDKNYYYIPQFYQKNRKLLFSEKHDEKYDEKNNFQEEITNRTDSLAKIIERRIKKIDKNQMSFFHSLTNKFKSFYFRLIPTSLPKEHEITKLNRDKSLVKTELHLIKPGQDYYSPAFAVCLIILAYFILFYQKMIGKRETFSDTLDNNSQFSGDLVLAIVFILVWIIIDRVIYNLKKSNDSFVKEKQMKFGKKYAKFTFGEYSLHIKIAIHLFIFAIVHYYFCFKLPFSSKIFFINSPPLIICYFLFTLYLYYSAFQIKYGYPEFDSSQIFTDSTDLFNRLAFKSKNLNKDKINLHYCLN